ncbi:LOW QUALITY PROTEIN: tumor-associated calcium signal transducer 2 [Podargus strigoides]
MAPLEPVVSLWSLFGVMLGLILAVASSAQNNCACVTNNVCTQDASGNCTCTLVVNLKVDCSTLTSKRLLMKAEMIPVKMKHFWGHRGLSDNDGIYNPDCKGDKSLSCRLRTSWIYTELKHKIRSSAFDVPDVANTLKHLLKSRYKLGSKYITATKYDSPLTQIHLNQNEKSRCDVDIADVAFEKDIKGDSLFYSNSTLTTSVNGDALDIEKTMDLYVAEKPPEFCMREVVAGVSAVVTVVMLTASFGITVLVILRWLWTTKKVDIKEIDEVRAASLQLP